MPHTRFPAAAVMVCALLIMTAAGCTTYQYRTRVDNAPGSQTSYEDPAEPGAVEGVGIESQDLISMTDQMVRDMLSNRKLAARKTPPQVIIDSQYFRNESSSRLNKNLITDRLRVGLNRAANGRMAFIGRHYSDMYEKERTLKREGVVDSGTLGLSQKSAGGDYRLGGRIATLDSVDPDSGTNTRYHQIIFEMVELETGSIVWSGMYEFKKSARDDVIYR